MISNVKRGNLLFSIIFWTLALVFYVVIRLAGDVLDGQEILTVELILQVAVTGMIVGAILGSLGQPSISSSKTKRSFLVTIIVNSLAYLVFFSIIIFISSLYGNSLEFAKEFFLSTESLMALLFMAVSSVFFHFIFQMNRMFGPGVLIEYSIGKYFNPVEEERIFMFLDLKSSTSIAEKLGHQLYSRLIQDCFTAVARPTAKFNGRIYQYVGDEVVITWKLSTSLNNWNCVQFFFAFQELLQERKKHFNEQYGLVPEFKAGLHCGRVMAAEVGELKSEIAYHGDVLNAAARIQGLCNDFSESLLISEDLLDQMQLPENFDSTPLGNVVLKGKEEKIKVHSINQKDTVA